jgi:hypothetical protein
VIVLDAGGGATREFVVVATRAGRRVEVDVGPRKTTVTEVKSTGRVIRSSTFMSSRVIALVEEPLEAEKPTRADRRRLSETPS